ncbi:hypothetical protein [Aquimarina algicola]|uniref:Uncharacterized protein n=1 Tax=Aquimarina algicola TaxID=2589995 RepID=A0A504J896_9FLAO|nr:hypothetical protein [Aquimarina algicola]TPN87106.1 hypothetical protein FHK87_05810 [Aquimarina algicola]
MLKYPVIIFTLFYLTSCKTSQEELNLSDRGTILLDSEYNRWLRTKYGYVTWKPKKEDLRILNIVINKAIKNNKFNFIKQPINKNIETYYRQYIPYINESNERLIKINAFCELLKTPPTPSQKDIGFTNIDWKEEYVEVEDGESCYWELIINIDTKEYE